MGLFDTIFDPGKDERRRGRDALASVAPPSEDQLRLQLEQLVLQGELRPEEAETILLGPSAFERVQTDPRLRGSQMDALAELEKIVGAGGLDARAKASLEDALSTQRTETRGANEAILDNARARGIAGSDLELVNRLVAQQGAATRGSRAALDTAALAEQRRADALRDQTTLASNIRNQDFGEASRKAEAEDLIDRYNAANRQGQVNLNVGARNDAQRSNLAARQGIADQNVGIRNDQTRYNAQLPLTLYDLQRTRAGDEADYQLGEAQAGEARNARVGSAVTSLASLALSPAFGQLTGLHSLGTSGPRDIRNVMLSDERAKADVEPLDSRALLHELAGSSWEYKGSGEPGVGVMAQDMERTPMKDAVSERADGLKQIDYGELGIEPDWLAVLADMNKRLEAVEGGRRHG